MDEREEGGGDRLKQAIYKLIKEISVGCGDGQWGFHASSGGGGG